MCHSLIGQLYAVVRPACLKANFMARDGCVKVNFLENHEFCLEKPL